MFQVYVKDEAAFDPKRLVGEYNTVEKAYAKAEELLKKNADIKYVIEETSGFVDNYGELIATVVDEN